MIFLKMLEVFLTSRNAEMHLLLKCVGVLLLPSWHWFKVFNKDVYNTIFWSFESKYVDF